MKKTAIASCLAGAGFLSTTAFAFTSTPIVFDRNGGDAGGAITVTTFDWTPDNGVSINVIGEAQDGSSKELRAQASLGTFQYITSGGSTNYLPLGNSEFTFQLSVWEFASGIGGGTAGFSLDSSKPSLFTIYYDATKDSVPLTGTGYGDGVAILTGSIVGLTGNFTSFTDLLSQAFPPVALDGFGTNNYPNVITDQGNGSTTLEIDVLSFDPAFFKSQIASLTIDVNLTTNAATPFVQTDPSSNIYGHPVNWGNNTTGQKWNGKDDCGTTALDNCDFHFQTDASNTFQATPEPGSLALLGLGMGLMGWASRRRKET